jgi:hypothetical protein
MALSTSNAMVMSEFITVINDLSAIPILKNHTAIISNKKLKEKKLHF